MSLVPGLDDSLNRDVSSVPTSVNVRGAAASNSVVPPASTIRSRQVVRDPAAVTLVVGVTLSFAPGGKTPSTPVIDQSVARPMIFSGFAAVAFHLLRTSTRICGVVASSPSVVPW